MTKLRGLKMPAISIVEKTCDTEIGFTGPLGRCLNKLCDLLSPQIGLVGFCAQHAFLRDSAVVRSKGLWKSNDLFKEIRRSAQIGPEQVKTRGSEIRFYGICRMPLHQSLLIMEAIRSLGSCFALLDEELNVEDSKIADLYYQAAFSPTRDWAIQWPKLLCFKADSRSKIIRATGTHDDREVSLDVFNWTGKSEPYEPVGNQ